MQRKNQRAAAPENRDELVGVLTAISIVSKRLARKLALLDRLPDKERSDADNGSEKRASPDAD